MMNLTGWLPHHGTNNLTEEEKGVEVYVLLRGTPEHGPRESGPSPAGALNWDWAPAQPNYKPSPMDAITGKAPPDPSGDIIAWVAEDKADRRTRYPHVRADLGMGR